MSNNSDSYKVRQYGPGRGPDYLQMLSADDTSKHRVEVGVVTLSSELVCVPDIFQYAVLFARRCFSNAIFACISKSQTELQLLQ